MQELLDRILTANLIFTALIFYVAARIYLLPKIRCGEMISQAMVTRSLPQGRKRGILRT